jgi:hypothetical protein
MKTYRKTDTVMLAFHGNYEDISEARELLMYVLDNLKVISY